MLPVLLNKRENARATSYVVTTSDFPIRKLLRFDF